MKYKLNQVIIFEGEEAIIWDYSHRYRNYDIKKAGGKVIYGVSENEITESK